MGETQVANMQLLTYTFLHIYIQANNITSNKHIRNAVLGTAKVDTCH